MLVATAALLGTTCENATGPAAVASVVVTPATWTATAIGDTVRFTAVAKDAHGVTIGSLHDTSFTWQATPPGIVFMRHDGLATAYGPGPAVVSATIDRVTGTADVSVTQVLESVVFIYLGDPIRALEDSLRLNVEARDHNSYPIAGATFSFQSLDPNVATVSTTGYVKALGPGAARIVASDAGKADTVTVPVVQDVATIALSPDTAIMEEGATRQFIATMKDHNGYPVTDRLPQWSSSDTLMVRVNSAGLATATAVRLGPATVIATSGGARGESPAYVFATFLAVAAGPSQTCAVSSHGRPYCWGWIDYTSGQRSPVPLAQAITPALDSSIGAGVNLSCGLTAGGVAYCWGDSPLGKSGAAIGSAFPFSSLAVGYGTAYGLTASGDAYSWNPVSLPAAPVPGGLSFTSMSATYLACGIVAGGAAYCWGPNLTGGIGDSTYTDRATPTAVVGGHTFTLVVAGGGHTCGITTGGPTYCWGRNPYGAFGDSTTTNSPFPVPAAGGLGLTSLTLGDFHTCGLIASGAAFCWGLGIRGSIGNDSFEMQQLTPAPVSGGLTFASISAGGQHTCALTSTGALYCWGRNEDGELGDGTGTNRAVPTLVAGSRH